MGPVAPTKGYQKGGLVKLSSKPWVNQNTEWVGTIVENWVDFDIASGKREEKALVLWPDGRVEWHWIISLDLISSNH